MSITRYTPLNPSQAPIRDSKRTKFVFVLLCFAFLVSVIYINSLQNMIMLQEEDIAQEMLDAAAKDASFAERYRNKDMKTSDLKYILLWTPDDVSPFDFLGKGQESFIINNCAFTNCFVTSNRILFGGDITKFDAIAFNGRSLRDTDPTELPQVRSTHQKYIFLNMESSDNQPVCHPWFDGFFNWTASYKLDSDIVYSYIQIRDEDDKVIGPKIDMEWITNMTDIDEEFKEKLKGKRKAAAWFVSHCKTRSKREEYVKSLQDALEPYGMTVDVYGRCGTLECERSEEIFCDSKLASDYYFYLSFENSFADDYTTEKLLTALNNDAVPIVYGGSNYSRFLPPGSYIDARQYKPEALAALMHHIISYPDIYHQFFRWRYHYIYVEPERVEDVCNVCEALNDKRKVQRHSVYDEFRSWWNPEWETRCLDESWGS